MKSLTLTVPLLSSWLKHGAGTLFIYFADEIIWNSIICIIICKWIIWRQHEKKQRQSPGVEGFCGKLEGKMRKMLWNVLRSMVRQKRGESRHRWVKVHGEQLYKKSLAGRLERVTRGVTFGFWEEWFVRHFDKNVSSSLEDKGKKLGKK